MYILPMEISTIRKVERILIVTCLIIAPAIATPKGNSEVNSNNAVQVPKFPYLSEDTSKEDTWNYDYPRFSMPVQEKSLETKRRSSFFPVRGKKNMQNVHLFDGKSVPENIYFSRDSPGGFRRLPILRQHSLENVDDASDVMDSLKWTTVQKRPSSFMPMRGRKRQVNGENLQVLEKYLSSKAHEDVFNPAYKDMIFRRPVYNGMRKIDADQTMRINYPNFYDKPIKDDVNFLGRNYIEKRFKFFADDPSVEEVENGGSPSNKNFFFSNGRSPEKRALSFVPTRGRREKLPEIESDLGIPRTVIELSESFPTGLMSTNLSGYPFQSGGENHQRYRRASAFMPMRGRKSLSSPYGPPSFFPVEHIGRLGDSGRFSSMFDTEKELVGGIQESFGNIGDQRQKRDFDGAGMQSPFTQQKLRTALVMKRPLSFFAARGKRFNVSGIDVL